jgi:hypothetical protein
VSEEIDMGLFGPRFGPSKQEREELAARADESAAKSAANARADRTEAAVARKRWSVTDPEAARAIAGHLDRNARIQEGNARDAETAAQNLRKPWWR